MRTPIPDLKTVNQIIIIWVIFCAVLHAVGVISAMVYSLLVCPTILAYTWSLTKIQGGIDVGSGQNTDSEENMTATVERQVKYDFDLNIGGYVNFEAWESTEADVVRDRDAFGEETVLAPDNVDGEDISTDECSVKWSLDEELEENGKIMKTSIDNGYPSLYWPDADDF